MKKMMYFLIFICTFLFLDNVNATGGGLRKKSIKTCPNGVTYGAHSDGKGGIHWHIAATNGKSYYAKGSAISNDPCPSSTTNKGTASSTSGSKKSNTTTSNNTSKKTSNTAPVKPQVKVAKSSDTSISSIIINGDVLPEIKDEMNYTSTKKDLDVKLKTSDSKSTYKISGNITDIPDGKETKIYILVVAEDGTQKKYTINVYREKEKSSVKIENLKLNGEIINFDEENSVEINTYDDKVSFNIDYELSSENAKLIMKKDGEEVLNGEKIEFGENKYELVIVDSDGKENIYHITINNLSLFNTPIVNFSDLLMSFFKKILKYMLG